MIDSWQLIYVICDWFTQIVDIHGKHLFIDGKGILAAAEKNRNKKTPYIMNVLEATSSMVVMPLRVGDKTNKIAGMANKGKNPNTLQYIMEHSNIIMTLGYYAHASYASAKSEMDRLCA